jgi:hypothetical protein
VAAVVGAQQDWAADTTAALAADWMAVEAVVAGVASVGSGDWAARVVVAGSGRA